MIEEALVNILKNDPAIKNIVSGRVYPYIPQGIKTSCITYQQTGGDEDHSSDGPIGLVDARFQITCWAPTPIAVTVLSRKVKKRLNGYSDEIEGIQYIKSAEPVDVPYFGEAEQQTRFGRMIECIISFNDN